MKSTIAFVVLVGGLAALLGCGGALTDEATRGRGSSDGGEGGYDAAAFDSAERPDSDGVPPEYEGAIYLVGPSTPTSLGFKISFFPRPPAGSCSGGWAGKWGRDQGDCCVQDAASASEPVQRFSAGDLTAVAKSSRSSIRFEWREGFGYLSSDSGFAWLPGEDVELTAAGGVIGAFSAKATSPELLSNVDPKPPAPFVVSLTSDVRVTFAASTASRMELTVGSRDRSVTCGAPDGTGDVRVPATLIAQTFAPGDEVGAVLTRVGKGGAQSRNARVELGIVEYVAWRTTSVRP